MTNPCSCCRNGLQDLLPPDVEWLYHTGKEFCVCCHQRRPLDFRGGNVSQETAPSTSCSQAAVLNPSQNIPDCMHHVLHVAGNVLEGGQPFKSPDQGVGPIPPLRPSMTSPTLSHIYKGAQRTARAEDSLTRYSAQPPSPEHRVSAGVLALREVLSTMPRRLLPPYLCIWHHSLPSPSAVRFKQQ